MTLRLFILISIFNCAATSAQDCLKVINNMELYSGSHDIINGTKWSYVKKYLGSPMLMENYWPKADISYDGARYTGVLMNYDVYKNEFIIYNPEKGSEKYVVIGKERLAGFSFTDAVTNRKHNYEYVELPGIKGKALYENATSGNIPLYIKPVKLVVMRSSVKGQGEYSGYFEYYLKTGDRYTGFKSKAQLINLLAIHSAELNKFIRKNKLKINSNNPEGIIALLNFFGGLK